MSEPAVAVPLLPQLAQDCDIHTAPEALLPHRMPLAVATSLGEACAAPRNFVLASHQQQYQNSKFRRAHQLSSITVKLE
jgi:hypothetical protein